ncbi:MAG: hypothetical protein DRP87_19305, partial [Spirochaetes bacterium]
MRISRFLSSGHSEESHFLRTLRPLKSAIAESDYFELFAQDALENLDSSFKEVYGGLFGAEGLEALLKGRYFEDGNSIKVTLKVISFQTGHLVGRGEA